MRLVLLLIIFSVSSCATLPDKPSPDLCVIDYPREEVICGKKEEPTRRMPLSDMDRGIVFAPDEWEDIQSYMDILTKEFKLNCF